VPEAGSAAGSSALIGVNVGAAAVPHDPCVRLCMPIGSSGREIGIETVGQREWERTMHRQTSTRPIDPDPDEAGR
jgi:hypothetical protein